MMLVMETCVLCDHFGDDKAFEIVKKAGFDGIDYTFFNHHGQAQLFPAGGGDFLKSLLHIGNQYDASGYPLRQILRQSAGGAPVKGCCDIVMPVGMLALIGHEKVAG